MLAGGKKVAAPFGNADTIVRARYDFAADGGASDISKGIIEADGELLVTGFYGVIKTETTGTSSKINVGVAGSLKSIVSEQAPGAAGTVIKHEANPFPIRLADGAKLLMTLDDSNALTAGVIEWVATVRKP